MRSDQDLEQRLEKKLNDVNSFNNHINNDIEIIKYFENKINKSKKKYIKYEILTTILKSFDTILITATTSSSFTLSVIGMGLVAIPISFAIASGLSNNNKVVHEIIMQK